MNKFFPAEWFRQDGVLLAWPHAATDWHYMLQEVEACYVRIAEAIVADERLMVVAPDTDAVRRRLAHLDQSRISYYDIPTNDTWARDFGALTLIVDGKPQLLNFTFNGWGMKFASYLDNQVTARLHTSGAFSCSLQNHLDMVLEGGAIESDGNGTILTTSSCLLAPNHNDTLDREALTRELIRRFNARQVLWLDYGRLEGDDTDGHIDTMARFAPDRAIVYVGSPEHDDSHYDDFRLMERQLQAFRNADGEPYRLIALPFPHPVLDTEGNRLPATYANFLVTNTQVLVPTYNQPDNDNAALNAIQEAFPTRKIIGIDCTPLIQQHGSLHCVTMQFFENTLAKTI